MTPYGYSIVMGFQWRGATEEFSNVFHYNHAVGPSEADHQDVVNQIVSAMKPKFGSNVNFLRARVWGPTNQGKALSVTKLLTDLSGAGGRTTGTQLPKELSVVCSFYIGRNPATGRKRFLRKYFHCAMLASTAAGDPALGNSALPVDTINDFTSLMNGIKTFNAAGANQAHLCTPQGDQLPLGSDPKILPHLHTRQLKQ